MTRRFVTEKPRVIPLHARHHEFAKFEMEIGERGSDDFHFTTGDEIAETLDRFAEIVARDRLYDAHRARSWSE